HARRDPCRAAAPRPPPRSNKRKGADGERLMRPGTHALDRRNPETPAPGAARRRPGAARRDNRGGGWSALLELFTKGPPPDLTQPPYLRPGSSGQVHVAVYRMPMA